MKLDEKTRSFTLEVREAPFLTKDEKKETRLFRLNPHFNSTLKEEDTIKTFTVNLPDEVILESVERFDNDTEYGWILELLFKKKEKVDTSKLIGKRFGHMRTSSITKVALYRGDDDEPDSKDETENTESDEKDEKDQ